jgi:hypothetical protein
MTLDSLIDKLIRLRDFYGGGNLEVFAKDSQGGSYQVGSPNITTPQDCYAEWGAIAELIEELNPEQIVTLHMDN